MHGCLVCTLQRGESGMSGSPAAPRGRWLSLGPPRGAFPFSASTFISCPLLQPPRGHEPEP